VATRSIRHIAWFLVACSAAAAVLAGWNGSRVALRVVAALVVAWVTAAVLIGTDYRDADGFMECRSGCTAVQDVVGIVFFYSPAMLVCVTIGSLAAWITRRVKR